MEYENTKSKGDTAELEVALYLKKRGYVVATPYGENQPYDLIVESPTGHLYRVQVRHVTWHEGYFNLSLRIVSKNYARLLDMSRIDAFAAWDGNNVFFVPTSHVLGHRSMFTVRRVPAKNNQKKRTSMASEYADALHHLQ